MKHLTLADALHNRRKVLVNQLRLERTRNSPRRLHNIARELREISKRQEAFLPQEPQNESGK